MVFNWNFLDFSKKSVLLKQNFLLHHRTFIIVHVGNGVGSSFKLSKVYIKQTLEIDVDNLKMDENICPSQNVLRALGNAN